MSTIFLTANDIFTLLSTNTNDSINGRSGGNETVILQGNPTGTVLDGNIETVQVAGTASNTTLQVNATTGRLELSSGGIVYATFSGGLNQAVDLQFTDGNVRVTQTGANSFTIANPTNANDSAVISPTSPQLGSAVSRGNSISTAGDADSGGGSQPVPPTISFATTNGQTTEGNSGTTNVTFAVTLSQPSTNEIRVDFDTLSGSAIEGLDYSGASGTLIFSPGTTQQVFDVDILGDTNQENSEFFFVELDNLQNAIFDLSQDYFGGNVPSKLVTTHSILDDDNPNGFSQTINSNFLNSYTFTISGTATSYSDYFDAITLNAIEVIEYLSDFISWEGILDFVVNFDGPINYGPNGVFTHGAGNGLLPAYGGIAANGQTFAQQEALTGVDSNGSDYDLGLYLLPNVNGSLTNYGFPLFFDGNPNAYSQAEIPSGHHDFFSIFLHEVLHGMAFWSTAQHNGFGNSSFDDFTVLRSGQYYFEGAAVLDLLGAGLPLATTGSRDHYGFNTNGPNPVERGTVFEFGNYEQNRWHLGQVELAVLTDMGYLTANEALLPLVEQPDQSFSVNLLNEANRNSYQIYDFL